MEKKINIFVVGIILIILLLVLISQYLLPDDFCISDNQCVSKFSHCSCSYYCTTKHLASIHTIDCARECDTEPKNNIQYQSCMSVCEHTASTVDCEEQCLFTLPKSPNCKCVNFHCKDQH